MQTASKRVNHDDCILNDNGSNAQLNGTGSRGCLVGLPRTASSSCYLFLLLSDTVCISAMSFGWTKSSDPFTGIRNFVQDSPNSKLVYASPPTGLFSPNFDLPPMQTFPAPNSLAVRPASRVTSPIRIFMPLGEIGNTFFSPTDLSGKQRIASQV